MWDGSSTWGTTGISFPRGVLWFAELVGLARKIYDRPRISEAPISYSVFYDCWPIYDSASRLQIRSGLHGDYNNTHHAVVQKHRGFGALGMRMLCVETARLSSGPHPPGLIAEVTLIKLFQYCYLGYSKRPSPPAFSGEPVTQTMPLNHCACCWFWNKWAIWCSAGYRASRGAWIPPRGVKDFVAALHGPRPLTGALDSPELLLTSI